MGIGLDGLNPSYALIKSSAGASPAIQRLIPDERLQARRLRYKSVSIAPGIDGSTAVFRFMRVFEFRMLPVWDNPERIGGLPPFALVVSRRLNSSVR